MPSDDLPKMGPWITFDEGEYDEMPYPNENIGTSSVCLVEGDWISFDDGTYEEPTQPNCDDDDRFSEIDGDEIWTYAVFPEYEDCECSTEACLVDNFPYLNMTAYRGSDILDGGEVDINCCIIDDGVMGPGPFESAWNVGPDFTDCGKDSEVNPYYCCLIDNETFVFGDPPYYGPDFVDGCTMNSRFVRLDVKRPNLILNSDLELNDWPPTETDNGVFNVDSWDLDDKDPECLPYYCNISNGWFTGGFMAYDYTIDDCTMSVSNVIDDTCPDPDPPFPITNLVEEPVISPVYETFIETCKNDSCWSDCDTCDPATLCPPDDVYVKVGILQGEVLYKMHPGLENAYTPLRLWKAPTLNVTDTVRNHDTDIWNYLVADDNRGTNPEDAYRSFVRLPLEYARDGREWSKARTVCENMLYWSSTSNSVEAKYVDKADPNVFLYEEQVGKVLPDNSTIYFEDFLYSSTEEDGIEGNTQPGFEEAQVTYEAPFEGPFQPFVSVDYNPFELRTPRDDGEWRGNYYRFIKEGVLSGHISRDVQNSILELSTGPVYDMSEVKHPLTYFPEEDDKQTIKNYVVSYAYFAADLLSVRRASV